MKKMRGIHLPYEEQGLVYFTCRTFKRQPKEVQDKIINLCLSAGGEHDMALFLVLTTAEPIQTIAMRCHVSPSVLYERRKRFYESWFEPQSKII